MNTLTPLHVFAAFPKMGRLSRECVITEKIDGTNAQISICPALPEHENDPSILTTVGHLAVRVGSRNRWLTNTEDNYGFARWCFDHLDEVASLGEGRHFGEWWGNGVQRGYGVATKRLSLFNVHRWCLHGHVPLVISDPNPRGPMRYQDVLPPCVGLVPTLYTGMFDTRLIEAALELLQRQGSKAAPGFANPEGIVVYHTAAKALFKKTIEGDGSPKSLEG